MGPDKKKTGWPFQEGFVIESQNEMHVFTDFRWDDETIERVWFIQPDDVALRSIVIRPVSLDAS
jgi:hypothetical protein